MLAADEKSLGTFERKILRKIFGPICGNAEYRRRMNHELYEQYDDVELARRVTNQRLRWLGHVVRMDGQAPARRVFKTNLSGGSRRSHIRVGDTRWNLTSILLQYLLGARLQANRLQRHGK